MLSLFETFVVVGVLFTSACVPDHGPWMLPGEDCMQCHAPEARASSKWTAAGTVFDSAGNTGVEGAEILIVDATGRALTLTSNGAGNFYTGETLTPPFQWVGVKNGGTVTWMPQGYSPTGACNSCHQPGGTANKPIVVP